jgi:chromosome segregation ATPase
VSKLRNDYERQRAALDSLQKELEGLEKRISERQRDVREANLDLEQLSSVAIQNEGRFQEQKAQLETMVRETMQDLIEYKELMTSTWYDCAQELTEYDAYLKQLP